MSDQGDLERTPSSGTRMLFLGDAALTDGFQLIGFETWSDPTREELDRVLQELLESRRNAFILLDTRLAKRGSPMLDRVRKEGGRILVTEVPPLNEPEGFHSSIDNQVNTLMGNGDL
ncbi:MAG: ATPase [Gammaproteobacteria bacterium]|nr:ATPase [Gammaproteobacteria bacterium]